MLTPPVPAQNFERQYAVWAGIALRNEMADINPKFDPTKPYDEPIFWREDALDRLTSMDEKDVRADQTKRGRSAAMRSVKCQAPGSRHGHGKGVAGRKRKCESESESGLVHGPVKVAKGGFKESGKVGGRFGLRPGEIDAGNAIATKSASKITFVGGTTGSGKALPPFILSDHPLSTEELDAAPQGTVRDSEGKLIPAGFTINKSGGMESVDMTKWFNEIAHPAMKTTQTLRGMQCADGLGQHHKFGIVSEMTAKGSDPCLRFPHGSSRGQHEDFAHFAIFQPAFEKAKVQRQLLQFKQVEAKAIKEGREPTRSELIHAGNLSNLAVLECARKPWEQAFSRERIIKGWADEGVVPFTRKLYWDLKAEEDKKGVQVSEVPTPNMADFGLDPIARPTMESRAILPAGPMDSETGWDEGIDEEVQRLLRNERGQPELLITAVHPPKSMPKLTSALLYQLPGGVTGASGKKLLRAEEVERRLNIARTELNKRDSEQRRSLQANADWGVAADGLNALKDNSFKLDKLKIPALQSLVRVLNVGKTTGLKKNGLCDLLSNRFGHITPQEFAELQTTVQRGVSLVALPAPPMAPQLTGEGASATAVSPTPPATQGLLGEV